MPKLNEQELHNLAMNIVGKDLEDNGYDFLGVNSKLKRNPQFVALKNTKLHFVIVRAIQYPDDPKNFDRIFMETIKEHALKFNARTFYAGVGLANSADYEKPITSEEDYVVNYQGWQEV
ncbi:Na(+)-translocating NADH-quinone reductase subunit F [Zunongwangia sp. F260]|uniref:Na(+)-translocating NADH-quinone reductase subunit F n=2 Tax=Autumnicola TaxID=3160927 RepID=A0ABU3CMI6_9FLAO|nr:MULTISPECIES: Na(+)-translocating NADH-quinone reductase subunit F [unclassified Zunongwangia]MDT0647506.1 Na(+)-translocating NADH-quinone reductase subunit F [Zunongwangia sp. F260]MDT0684919.1 Na(+)-translocating NADH-quinone reductase subunit F [Zunongwangia sp. F225]